MTSIRKNLVEYLLKCNQYELMAEKLREKIAENAYYQSQTVFERFDKFKKGYLVPDDLAEFMLDNRIYPTQVELYLIFRDFDKQRVGVITLQKLSEQLLPKQRPSLRQKATDRKYYKAGIRLEIDLEFFISKYFEHKIKEIKQLSLIRIEMLQRQVFTVQEAFTLLDNKKKGVLSGIQQVDQFLRGNGKVVTKDELLRIFRVLSFDSDSQILYQTFSQHLDPLGKGYYIGYSQRLAEKHLLQQDFIRKKVQINSQIVRNSRERVGLSNQISNLRESNRRLQYMLQQQEIQRTRQEEELIAFRLRRNYF